MEANVFLHDNEQYPQIFLQGYRNLNRAVHDDVVAVELLPESECATPTSLVLEELEEDVGDFVNEKEEDEQIINKPDVKKLPKMLDLILCISNAIRNTFLLVNRTSQI